MDATTAAWVRAWAWTPALRANPPRELCPCAYRLMGGCEDRHDLCPGISRRPRPRTHLVGTDGEWRYWPPGIGPVESVGWGTAAGRGPVRLADVGCVWVCPCHCHQADGPAAPVQDTLF